MSDVKYKFPPRCLNRRCYHRQSL